MSATALLRHFGRLVRNSGSNPCESGRLDHVGSTAERESDDRRGNAPARRRIEAWVTQGVLGKAERTSEPEPQSLEVAQCNRVAEQNLSRQLGGCRPRNQGVDERSTSGQHWPLMSAAAPADANRERHGGDDSNRDRPQS
jgi:hypothetical protein